VEIDIKAPEAVTPVLVDPGQLELALLNLAVNARDAMPQGGSVTFTVSEARQPGEGAADQVLLQVTDTGSGMDAETLKRAIEPFFSTKDVGKGTGLGLSMVHGLLAQLGGRMELASIPGQGTTVALWLPLAEGAPEAREPALVAHAMGDPATVLLVDDDELVATATADVLAELGHRVIRAGSGSRALQILRSCQDIDVILTDYAMPGMNGLELAAAARELRPGLPVVLATGYAQLRTELPASFPRLSKPYRTEELEAELAKAIGIARAR